MNLIKYCLATTLVVALAACRNEVRTTPSAIEKPSADSVTEAIDSVGSFRGFLTIGPEVKSMKLCGSTDDNWVVDQTNGELVTMYRQLASKPYDPVYVEVNGALSSAPPNGFGSAFQGSIIVKSLERAKPAQVNSACDDPRLRGEFHAAGTEPFWVLHISRGAITFTQPSDQEGVNFPYKAPRMTASSQLYTSKVTTSVRHSITVNITKRRCVDSMSGEYFAFAVEVTLDKQHYRGCGMTGDEPVAK